jgi:hypothetical protein
VILLLGQVIRSVPIPSASELVTQSAARGCSNAYAESSVVAVFFWLDFRSQLECV